MNIYKLHILAAAAISTVCLSAEEPAGYYTSCEGKTGKDLLQQLESVIGDHSVVSYNGLYTVYETSDRHPDGTIWDMYSTKNWGKSFSAVKCGNYSVIGDCINREHSFPKSWFDDKAPMISDAYHIYPTDGKVNGQRSSYPYGECANGTYEKSQGNVHPLGKLGSSTFPGYSGTVFEPDDQYKGDFARTYFYMAACYNSKISSWSSPMLAGNNYPCFSSWSINLLLKWHRQDPVSDKETVRNDAVNQHQHNRNPFIDHPELAEYIWGDKVGQPWSLSLGSEPKFITPVDNSTVDLGLTAVDVPVSATVNVSGINLKSNPTVTVSGTDFQASPSTLDYTQVNGSGASITISYLASTVGKATGKVVISSSEAESVTVTLVAEAVNGLPALPATYVSSDAFTANWVNINGQGAKYTLDVRRDGASLEGYPLQVDATAGSYRVTDLEPETTYTYTVSNGSLTSDVISVTTAVPVPSVTFLYDGDLTFTACPGEPSEVAEILADIDNIPGDVTLTVSAPFQLSLNKQSWSESIILSPGADRFYMRLFSENEGKFSTSLSAIADGGFFYDDVVVEGTVTPAGVAFIEDFEKQIPEGENLGYEALTYAGNAATWYANNAYFEYNGSNSMPHSGYQAVRFNSASKVASKGVRHIYMLEDKTNGIGSVTFWARPWKNDTGDCSLDVYISADHGASWEKVGEVTVKANNGQENVYSEHKVAVNRTGALRLKIEQTSGDRCMVDDIAMSDCKAGVQLTPEGHAYHSWDAYSVNGELVIENTDPANLFNVYSLDGREVFTGRVQAGSTTLSLPAGIYIVNVADFARRVLIK